MKQGFTLIELLVTILIVGILTSVALPQYQRSVERSRVTEALSNIRMVIEGMDRALLVNPNLLPKTKDYLDVKISGGRWVNDSQYETKFFTYSIATGDGVSVSRMEQGEELYQLLVLNRAIPENSGKSYCLPKSDMGQNICQSLLSLGYTIK